MTNQTNKYFIGVDVGTGSARAGVFDHQGALLAHASKKITLYKEQGDIAEQSSTEIWQAVCHSTREALKASGVSKDHIAGIGFDATCSLVVVAEEGAPLSVSNSNDIERNIIVWMDHRALEQTDRINATKHHVLKYVGGQVSPEMEIPKLLWLKENKTEIFDHAWQFFDLTDYLTWRSSGSLARSSCTVTCKWNFLAHENRWDTDYLEKIGLNTFVKEDFSRIGTEIVEPGSALGNGLTEISAAELGLPVGTPVASGLIDAHAGGLGTVGAINEVKDATSCMAYVFGTSSCTMTSTKDPVFVKGVWGPYYSAMVPGLWLNEGGQSAAGASIDQLIHLHPALAEANKMAAVEKMSTLDWLSSQAQHKCNDLSNAALLAADINIVPEFLGNRSPYALPHARAIISGLGMERSIDNLLSLYIAGICGLAYGLRQIIDTQAESGAKIDTIMISGGAGESPLIRQIFADATGIPIVSSSCSEPVLLGSAILASLAANTFDNAHSAMQSMSSVGHQYKPSTDVNTQTWHQKKFNTFKKLQSVSHEIAQ